MYDTLLIIVSIIANLATLQTRVLAHINQTITISCELSGYLTEIQWKHNTLLATGSLYTISTHAGTKDAIGIDGAMRKSIISQLRINNINDFTIGTYTCAVPDTELMENITISISMLFMIMT